MILLQKLISALRESFHFTQAAIWLLDKQNAVYIPYLPGSPPAMRPGLNDPFVTRIISSDQPLSFVLDEIIDKPDTPAFIKAQFNNGTRKALITRLAGQTGTIGFIMICSDRQDCFPDNFKRILHEFAPFLSTVISNAIINDEITDERPHATHTFPDIIGSGQEMQKIYKMMSLVAGANSTVLLLGETGTGKEMIARAIHNASPRKDKPMIKINCAALPPNLIESELFGHERGAFTGASDRRIGKFELANNGTLFLDEIGEMPLELQVKLLRVIQERELERLGGRSTIKVNVRLIVATNRNLEEEVKAGRFRQDLFYRINVFPIYLPPLRQRLEDIEPLANFFLARYTRDTDRKIKAISPAVIRQLQNYTWPGNVRELEHLIERSILLTQDSVLNEIQIPLTHNDNKNGKTGHSHKTLQDVERSYIIEILKRYRGKIAGHGGASQFLEIPSTTLHSKIKKLGISKLDYFTKEQPHRI